MRNYLSLSNRQIKRIIATKGLFLDGRPVHSETLVKQGQTLKITLPAAEQVKVTPLDIPINVLHEDQDLLAVHKPAGLVVHHISPSAEHSLVQGVASYYQKQGQTITPRPVHRLDKQASGIVLFAKSVKAQQIITENWHMPQTTKQYWALVEGHLAKEGVIAEPIKGKSAQTKYQPLAFYPKITEINVQLFSGRHHQIRVHLRNLGFPLIGDPLYNPNSLIPASRLALHCTRLELQHPTTGKKLTIEAPIPRDEFCDLLEKSVPNENWNLY